MSTYKVKNTTRWGHLYGLSSLNMVNTTLFEAIPIQAVFSVSFYLLWHVNGVTPAQATPYFPSGLLHLPTNPGLILDQSSLLSRSVSKKWLSVCCNATFRGSDNESVSPSLSVSILRLRRRKTDFWLPCFSLNTIFLIIIITISSVSTRKLSLAVDFYKQFRIIHSRNNVNWLLWNSSNSYVDESMMH